MEEKVDGIVVNILGYDYLVVHLNELGANLGSHNMSTQTIFISNKAFPDVKRETLVHEIIEAINALLELNLPHPIITQLGVGIHQVFKDEEFKKMFYKEDE